MPERFGNIPVLKGAEKEFVKFTFENPRQVLPTDQIIRINTTNGRGSFTNSGEDFRSERHDGIEDSQALTTALGLMEVPDRKREGTLTEDFVREVKAEMRKNIMIHANVDEKSESHSFWSRPIASVIEDAATDTRGFDEVGRVRKNNIEDSLAVTERLGWMDINRASVLYRSMTRNWSITNIAARTIAHNVDESSTPVRLGVVTNKGLETGLGQLIDGNINAHFGSVIQMDGVYPMLWYGAFEGNHLEEIAESYGKEMPTELFENHSKVILAGTPAVDLRNS